MTTVKRPIELNHDHLSKSECIYQIKRVSKANIRTLEEQFALSDQLRRAVISVPSNIAEGSGRTSAKDQAHFLEMDFGSLMEVDCQMDIAQDLGYVSSNEHEEVSKQISQVAALLSGMRRKILGENSLIH